MILPVRGATSDCHVEYTTLALKALKEFTNMSFRESMLVSKFREHNFNFLTFANHQKLKF